ncbi:BTB/POZ domain containing protein [Aphelenchoides avenae]|nr:BTB/POZ domain containing protein [Aphelenchus avenae]
MSFAAAEHDSMGNSLNAANEPEEEVPSSSSSKPQIGRKRGRPKKADPEPFLDTDLPHLKIMKLDTPRYVHQKLFVEGLKSDITLKALGHSWRLHRIYLEQCDYFKALFKVGRLMRFAKLDVIFQDNWSDSHKKVFELVVDDKNITYEGLNNVLASLYCNEIEVDLEHLEGIIAAASMLNLISVIDRCAEAMEESLSDESALRFLCLSETYGFKEVSLKCASWLRTSFWRLAANDDFLKSLTQELLAQLLSMDALCVVEGEKDLYLIVKRWIFLNATGQSSTSDKKAVDKFFRDAQTPFSWSDYVNILRPLRVSHMVTGGATLSMLKQDAIIPQQIIDRCILDSWNAMLVNEELLNPVTDNMTDDFFYNHCMRVGRIIREPQKCWRWLGFNYGVDILVNYNNGTLVVKRNCLSQSTANSVRLVQQVMLHYRFVICSLDGKQLLDTGRKLHTLGIDRSAVAAVVEPAPPADMPIAVHFFYLCTIPGPSSSHYWKNFLQLEEARKSASREREQQQSSAAVQEL